MLFLNKQKKYFFIISMIIGFSFIFIGKFYYKTIPTSSTPISEHTIVLDAGHGLPDKRSN